VNLGTESAAVGGLDLDAWWKALSACALVGTSRRPVPALPDLGVTPREAGRPEESALDAAALAGMLRRAGARPDTHRSAPASAPADVLREAPARALQLLDLLVTQPPAGTHHRDALLRHWFRQAAGSGHRLPHRLLPAILELATGSAGLRADAARVLDARGTWLAGHNPEWAWAGVVAERGVLSSDLAPDEWARLPAQERPAALVAVRLEDPAAGRTLLLSSWTSDSAKERAAHLGALRVGLGPADEEVLESALDDRAAGVRDIAAELLDALPTSARALRMAARLRPLVSTSGLVRRTIDVTLPDDPDAAGGRDGLGKPPPGRSRRGWWLERIVAGAPLEIWTEISGADPATTLHRLSDADARAGVRRAVLARRDPGWAKALLADLFAADLLEILPGPEREQIAVDRLRGLKPAEVFALLPGLPQPWTPSLSAAVVSRALAEKDPRLLVAHLVEDYGERLHPDSIGPLQAWRSRADLTARLDSRIAGLVQLHSVKRSITEAFT
jgi:hypothetical protein